MCKRKTIEQFIVEANIIHNNEFDYSLSIYTNTHTRLKIICTKHGVFEKTPNDHLSGKCGCPSCFVDKQLTLDKFIINSNRIHDNAYDYSLVSNVKSPRIVSIICPIHGIFKQNIYSHLSGCKCPRCVGKGKKNKEMFINEANIIHNNLYNYELVNYNNTHNKVKIICNNHGIFEQSPVKHLIGNGCPYCVTPSYSKQAIKWITNIEKTQRILIQHALNGGEFHIPGTRFKADGYCQETNTIYEFHGDYWHGNPKKFKPDERCHPWSELTAGELYNKTKIKENKIMELGYNLVVMWESDYNGK